MPRLGKYKYNSASANLHVYLIKSNNEKNLTKCSKDCRKYHEMMLGFRFQGCVSNNSLFLLLILQ